MNFEKQSNEKKEDNINGEIINLCDQYKQYYDKPRKLWKLEQEISDHREERTNYYGKQSKERLVVSTGPRRKFALTISSSLPRVVRLLVLPRET